MEYLSLTLPGGQNIQPPGGVPSGGLSGAGGDAINLGIQLIFIIGIVLAVAFIIISGIQMIVSGGDKQKVQAVRSRLTYSVIGLIIILTAFLIVSTVISLLGGEPSFFLPTP